MRHLNTISTTTSPAWNCSWPSRNLICQAVGCIIWLEETTHFRFKLSWYRVSFPLFAIGEQQTGQKICKPWDTAEYHAFKHLKKVRFNQIHWKCYTGGGGGGSEAGVNNERFSAKVKLWCKLDIHIALLPPSESRITVFPGGNRQISTVWKISSQLRTVPLGLRYQGIGSSINFSVFFIRAEWLGLGPKSYRRIFASHSSISSLRLQQR